MRHQLLSDVRILDFSSVIAGPYCTMLLGDLGADVVKVEAPGEGDDTRRLVRFPGRGPDDEDYFYAFNRNKRSIELDLRNDAGVRVARQLASVADVIVENFRPGVAERLGIGRFDLQAINPRLVYCSISGYGQTGPAAQRPGFDSVLQAFSGLMEATGPSNGGPLRVGSSLGDLSASVYAALGIVSALHARQRDGVGRWVDASLFESLLALMQQHMPAYFASGQLPDRQGNANRNRVPSNTYECADQKVIQLVANDRQWPVLCGKLGIPELATDARFRTHADRIAHRDEVDQVLQERISQRSRADVVGSLTAGGVPCAPVNDLGDALADPQVVARRIIWTLNHPRSGPIHVMGLPMQIDGHGKAPVGLPPRLGQHTDEILRELGHDDEAVERLREAGAFGRTPAR
jgi:crotonobetainyl-CoA:carnitine CoA-transferase CaiB-like acyl-CoA transferase